MLAAEVWLLTTATVVAALQLAPPSVDRNAEMVT
jgi:hypothetical protein